MSKWTNFVTKFYNEKKRSNQTYKFKDALVDAAKEYKKDASSALSAVSSGIQDSVSNVGKAVRKTVRRRKSVRRTKHRRGKLNNRRSRK